MSLATGGGGGSREFDVPENSQLSMKSPPILIILSPLYHIRKDLKKEVTGSGERGKRHLHQQNDLRI